MKSYADLEQSKKLAEILPIDSADMWFANGLVVAKTSEEPGDIKGVLPCWSLAALLDVLPFHLIVNNQRYAFSMHKGLDKDGETYMLRYNVFNTDVCLCLTDHYNSTVDACYEMIIKLHEQKLL